MARVNRFAALVTLDGEEDLAHLPNTGRMTELLVPGRPVMVVERVRDGRKTRCDLVLIEHEGRWVSVDARLPSQLVYQALVAGALQPWAGCVRVRREAAYGESRLDIELWRPARDPDCPQRCLIEAKSVNLVVDGVALFPDAPTLRGARHLRELTRAVVEGLDAAVFFVIQRPDARAFRPYDAADPEFGRALRQAAAAGVGVYAQRCEVTSEGMALVGPVTVELDAF